MFSAMIQMRRSHWSQVLPVHTYQRRSKNSKQWNRNHKGWTKNRSQCSVLSYCTHLLINSSKDSDATESTAEPNQSAHAMSHLPEESEYRTREQEPRRLNNEWKWNSTDYDTLQWGIMCGFFVLTGTKFQIRKCRQPSQSSRDDSLQVKSKKMSRQCNRNDKSWTKNPEGSMISNRR